MIHPEILFCSRITRVVCENMLHSPVVENHKVFWRLGEAQDIWEKGSNSSNSSPRHKRKAKKDAVFFFQTWQLWYLFDFCLFSQTWVLVHFVTNSFPHVLWMEKTAKINVVRHQWCMVVHTDSELSGELYQERLRSQIPKNMCTPYVNDEPPNGFISMIGSPGILNRQCSESLFIQESRNITWKNMQYGIFVQPWSCDLCPQIPLSFTPRASASFWGSLSQSGTANQ